MRAPRHQVDWSLVTVVILCVLAVGPFMIRPGLPPVPGYAQAAARAIEMGASLESGAVYPRWAPDFNYGYGSPLWNVIPPLPDYLTGLYRVAVQASAENSVKAIVALSVFLAGTGMLLFVRGRWGAHAGLIATSIYLFSPQLIVNRLYRDGDLPLLLAMGLLPAALAAVDSVLVLRRGRDVAVAVVAVAALWLTAAPLNVLLAGLLLGWLIWLSLVGGRQRNRAGWLLAVVSLLLGTLVAAIYWLPALAERNTVIWHMAASEVEVPRVLAWSDALALPGRLDLSAINPPVTTSVGLAVWLLPLLVWAYILVESWRRTPRDQRAVPRGDALQWRAAQWLGQTLTPDQRAALYFPILCVVLLLILLVPSPVRDWSASIRMEGLAMVMACGAVAVGQGSAVWRPFRRRAASLSGDVALLALAALVTVPVLTMPAWTYDPVADDARDVVRDEIRGTLIGGLNDGWLLPDSAPTLPRGAAALINGYETGQLDKVARDLLPVSVQADTIERSARQERLAVYARLPVTITLLTFDYPGWHAEIDGSEVPIVTTPDGFISVEVPAGRHEVKISFGSTPVRRAAWLIALLAVALTIALAVRLERQSPGARTVQDMAHGADWRTGALSCAAILMFGGAYGAAAIVPSIGAFRSSEGEIRVAEYPLPLALQGGIDLVAYDVEPDGAVAPGDTVYIALYWRAVRPDMPDYQVNLAVVGADDPARQVTAAQHRNPGGFPVSLWPHWPLRTSYVRDEYNLEIVDDAPSGMYRVLIQVGECEGNALMPCERIEPLFVSGSSETSLGQYIALPTDIVVR